MGLQNIKPRRFNREEYYRLADIGVFVRDERVELIDGTIVSMPPQSLSHSTAIILVTMLLTRLFHQTHVVSCQAPISLGDSSEPAPDFALVTPAHMQSCLREGMKPTCPDLVIEVADTSYLYDTVEKASLYASAKIAEYWVIDLRTRRLEVRQDLGPKVDGSFGHSYRSVRILHEEQLIAPLCCPEISLMISEMLPPL
jgi:Uma2 family endonuclease